MLLELLRLMTLETERLMNTSRLCSDGGFQLEYTETFDTKGTMVRRKTVCVCPTVSVGAYMFAIRLQQGLGSSSSGAWMGETERIAPEPN